MKLFRLFVFPLFVVLTSGCATTRLVSDAAMAGGGAALASELSNGDPLITAAGGAGGLLVSEGIHHLSQKQSEKAYLKGYEKGRSDSVKQQYWILVNQQKEKSREENVRLYEIPVPEQKIDNVILKPATKYLRIEE